MDELISPRVAILDEELSGILRNYWNFRRWAPIALEKIKSLTAMLLGRAIACLLARWQRSDQMTWALQARIPKAVKSRVRLRSFPFSALIRPIAVPLPLSKCYSLLSLRGTSRNNLSLRGRCAIFATSSLSKMGLAILVTDRMKLAPLHHPQNGDAAAMQQARNVLHSETWARKRLGVGGPEAGVQQIGEPVFQNRRLPGGILAWQLRTKLDRRLMFDNKLAE
jgi:hypothetical protein